MWIVTEKGVAINLSKSYKLTTSHFWTDKGEFYGVSALTAGIFFGDNNVTVDDTHIKSFRTEDEAKDYISDLVAQMNDEGGYELSGGRDVPFHDYRTELNGKFRSVDIDDDDKWDEDTAEDLDDDDDEEDFDDEDLAYGEDAYANEELRMKNAENGTKILNSTFLNLNCPQDDSYKEFMESIKSAAQDHADAN